MVISQTRRTATRRQSPRPFTPLDALVLIAATAAGLAWARATMGALHATYRPPTMPYSRHAWETGAACLLSTWTLALVALRLLRPRPRRRRLLRQPGLIAGCAMLLAVAIHCLWYLKDDMLGGASPSPIHETTRFILEPYRIVLAVCGAWMALALVRCWWPERSWIDRAGRALGVAWIVLDFGLVFAMPWLDPPDAWPPEAVRFSRTTPHPIPPITTAPPAATGPGTDRSVVGSRPVAQPMGVRGWRMRRTAVSPCAS